MKVHGFRIELGEIETELEQHPAVRQGVVMVGEDLTKDKRLVAYLVPNKGQTPSASVLREHLRQKLPEYMVPNTFVMLEKFPLTPNGKIDRRSLPSPNDFRPEVESAYLAPRTEMERTMAAIWQAVLHLEKIGVNDNFFDLGGNSLSSAILIAKINRAFKGKLPLSIIFQERTVSRLASLVENSTAHNAEVKNSQKKKVNLNDVIKLIG